MKIIKKQIVFILVISMVCLASFSFPLNAKASEFHENMASEEFIKLCDEFYTNPFKYKVVDLQNQDVSHKFYDYIKKTIKEKNYNEIWMYFAKNSYAFEWYDTQIEPGVSTRASVPMRTRKHRLQSGTTRSKPQTTFQVGYYIDSTCYVDSLTGKITGKGNTTVTVQGIHIGASYSGRLVNTSASQSINSNGKSVTVTVNTKFAFTFYLKNVAVYTDYFTFTDTFPAPS